MNLIVKQRADLCRRLAVLDAMRRARLVMRGKVGRVVNVYA